MIKRCVVCETPFEAKRGTAKYCSKRCSVRASRAGGVASITALPTAGKKPDGPLTLSTVRRLEEIGRTDSELGVAAVLLAGRLDGLSNTDTGAGVAALMKEYRATLAEAVRDAEDDNDALDDIRQAAALKLIRGA